MNIKLIRTDAKNKDFAKLVAALDAFLKISDGEDHTFYNQFNSINELEQVVLAYVDGNPLGCGALKAYGDDMVEVKRMYVHESARGQGIASKVLVELEQWAKELKYQACILETGVIQVAAVGLYKKGGYQVIPNYGQYEKVGASVCMKKEIN